MPLETIGSLALAGSSGASARGARSITGDSSNAAFAASKARGGDTGGNVIEIPSPAPNLSAYLSPYIRFDLQTRLAIVEIRDSQSGRVEQQYPSPRAVREYEQNLPEDSDLRAREKSEEKSEAERPEIEVTDGEIDSPEVPRPSFGSGEPAVPTITSVPPSVASAAAAAFSSLQNVLTGGRQLAVA